MWNIDEKVATKPYYDGELAIICTINRAENEQDWKSGQLVSTAAVLIISKLFIIYIYIYIYMKFTSPFFPIGCFLSVSCCVCVLVSMLRGA